MNAEQTAQLSSYKLIVKEAKANPASVALIPAFANGITALDGIITEIDQSHVQQSKDITGVTGSKNTLADSLTDWMVEISGAMFTYAIDQNDETLKSKIDYKQWQLIRLDRAEFEARGTLLLNEAKAISSDTLSNLGISPDDLTTFENLLTDYKNTSSSPREAIIDRSGYTLKLSDLFDKAYNIKKNTLDRLASQFIRKAPEFYQKYKAAAMVILRTTKNNNAATTPAS